MILVGAVLVGAVAMGLAVAGLFFLRFWRDAGDRLFLFFALAFFIMAVNRFGLALAAQEGVRGDVLYWVRFVAFALILVGIIDKNRSHKSSSLPTHRDSGHRDKAGEDGG